MIEVGEFLHSYVVIGMIAFISFLFGTQFGPSKNEQKK